MFHGSDGEDVSKFVLLSIWHEGRLYFCPRRCYENGINQVFVLARSKFDFNYLHLIISSFGYEKFKIWVVHDFDKFDEDGFLVETPNDFTKFIELTKKDKCVSVIVQHMEKVGGDKSFYKREEEVKEISKRKVAAHPVTTTKKT